MATLLRSDSTWKCLGYPSEALQTIDDLNRKLNYYIYYIYYIDDFNRHELGPDWGVIHYDGTGSVSLNGSTVTVSSAKSGDFYNNSDGGSLIYRPLPDDWIAVEVNVVNTQSLPGYMRTLMVRAGIEANMPFYVITPDNDCSHITVHWRDTAGASVAYAGNNTGLPFDRSKPLRLRIERDGTTLTAKLSYDNGATWQTIDSRTISQMKYVCLCASYHGDGYVVYDDFVIYASGYNNIVANENGFQLGSVPGSGEYISPQFSLYSFKAAGIPVISWNSGITDDVVAKPLIRETTQSDFATGELTNVTATATGSLELEGSGIFDDFTSFDTTKWTLLNDAAWVSGAIRLTRAVSSISGELLYAYDVPPDNFVCEFDYKAGGGSGADDTLLVFGADDIRYSNIKNGYRIAIDEYRNPNDCSANNVHIEVITNGTVQKLACTALPFDVDDGTWRRVKVEVRDGHIKVYINEVLYIDYPISINTTYRKFGFCARTGGANNEHWIDNVSLRYEHQPQGVRLSPIYDISSVGIAAGSSISWTATTPPGTSVILETRLSFDGGVTWQEWQQAVNGAPVSGISEGTDLSNARLQIRQTLSTTNPAVTPILHDVSVVIRPLNAETSLTFEVDVSLDGGNTWSGWQPVSSGDALPGVDATTNLDNVRFKYRLTMSSNNVVSPVVSNIRLENIVDWIDVLYDDSFWADAYDNGAYGISPFGSNPSGWPDSQARWIWDRKSTSSAPAGDVYFRKKFTLPESTWVTIAFTCDDKAELYVDGQYLLGNSDWRNTCANSIYLPAGEHVIAIKGANNASGVAGLLVTVRDAFSGIVSKSVSLGSRMGRIYEGIKKTITAGLRQVRDLTANVYIVDIFNTGPSTRKAGDYFLGVRSEIAKEDGAPPSQGNIGPARKFPFSWVPFVHQRWKPKL